MKTPKRITYCSCGCALNLESGDYLDDKGKSHNAAALFCPKCGAAHPGEAFAARCIRKNREARLRRKVAYMGAQIRMAELAIPGLLRYIERLKRGGDGHTLGLVLSGELASLGVAQMFLDMMKSIRRKGATNEQE